MNEIGENTFDIFRQGEEDVALPSGPDKRNAQLKGLVELERR